MFLDFGWSEILLIGVVALVVIGPKDLPKAMRVAGYWMRKARALSQEFHNSVEEVIREAELAEMRQELKKATEIDLEAEFERKIAPQAGLSGPAAAPELAHFAPPEAGAEEFEEPEIEPEHHPDLAGAAPPAGPPDLADPALASSGPSGDLRSRGAGAPLPEA